MTKKKAEVEALTIVPGRVTYVSPQQFTEIEYNEFFSDCEHCLLTVYGLIYVGEDVVKILVQEGSGKYDSFGVVIPKDSVVKIDYFTDSVESLGENQELN